MVLAGPASRLLTLEDLEDLPDDGRRHELLDGILVVTPSPGGPHQVVVGALYRALHAAKPSGAAVLVAPIDLVMSPHTVLQPDVVVVDAAEALEARLTRPPLMVVEVLSPSTRTYDKGSKMLAYAAAGIGWYWVVDPASPVEAWAFRLVEGRYEQWRHASGNEPFVLDEPFTTSLVPEGLLAV